MEDERRPFPTPNLTEQFLATETSPYFDDYMDALREIRRLSLLAHVEDPFIGYQMGIWGTIVRRLSEWQDDWDDFAAPLIQALGGNSADTPWQSIYRPVGGYAQTPARPAARRVEDESSYIS